jgi:hypothetical protein
VTTKTTTTEVTCGALYDELVGDAPLVCVMPTDGHEWHKTLPIHGETDQYAARLAWRANPEG